MFTTGSGATIGILASAVDPRIKVLDTLDPWGDWPTWMASSPFVPEEERAEYVKPEFLEKAAPLDPIVCLPKIQAKKFACSKRCSTRLSRPRSPGKSCSGPFQLERQSCSTRLRKSLQQLIEATRLWNGWSTSFDLLRSQERTTRLNFKSPPFCRRNNLAPPQTTRAFSIRGSAASRRGTSFRSRHRGVDSPSGTIL
jgi:hypothetical protein